LLIGPFYRARPPQPSSRPAEVTELGIPVGRFAVSATHRTRCRMLAQLRFRAEVQLERWSRQGIIPTRDSPSRNATIVMHKPLLERIRVLERAVQRWRLVCVAMPLFFVSSLAINGTFGGVMIRSGSNRHA